MNKVLILMSTYNGERYLCEQIDSLLSQKDVSCDILIRDDGSSDSTKKILDKYSKLNNNLSYYYGDNIGYAKSFWKLLLECPMEYDYYAFCDQDDIWMSDKLSRAINLLSSQKNSGPLLYTSDVIAINNRKDIIDKNFFHNNNVLSFSESLQKSILPGCTFVFNKEAAIFAKRYNGYMESHDWILYAIVSAIGNVIYDEESHIYYRIHDNNTIGKASRVKLLKERIKRFFSKPKCVRSSMARDIYMIYNNDMSEENKRNCYLLANYKVDHKKMSLIFNKSFKGIIFKIYVLLGKV